MQSNKPIEKFLENEIKREHHRAFELLPVDCGDAFFGVTENQKRLCNFSRDKGGSKFEILTPRGIHSHHH